MRRRVLGVSLSRVEELAGLIRAAAAEGGVVLQLFDVEVAIARYCGALMAETAQDPGVCEAVRAEALRVAELAADAEVEFDERDATALVDRVVRSEAAQRLRLVDLAVAVLIDGLAVHGVDVGDELDRHLDGDDLGGGA
jgi:hypothetical protein